MPMTVSRPAQPGPVPGPGKSSPTVQRPADSPVPAWLLETIHNVQHAEMLAAIPPTALTRPPGEGRLETQPVPEWVAHVSRQRSRWLESYKAETQPCVETPAGVNKEIIHFTRSRSGGLSCPV